jgi:hypothetical protein
MEHHSILTADELSQRSAYCDSAAKDELNRLMAVDLGNVGCTYNYNQQAYIEDCKAVIATWEYEETTLGANRGAYILMLIDHYTGA